MFERVRIRGFKSIADVTVNLQPVTVLIGRSGAGKSNFIRAIRFLRNYLANDNKAVEMEGGWQKIYPNGVMSKLAIDISFRLSDFNEQFRYCLEWGTVGGQWRLISESLCVGSEVLLHWTIDGWNQWPGEGQAPKSVPHDVQLNKFPISTESVLAYTALTTGIAWHDFPASIMTPYSSSPDHISIQGLADSGNNYLLMVLSLTKDLRSQRSRKNILARLKQINPTISSVELNSIQDPKKLIVGRHVNNDPVSFDLSQESDGFRRYYAHLLALYQTPPKLVLMFEEPENGIYPGALRNLAEEFVVAPTEQRGQIILTTQSPNLLDGFNPESLRLVQLHEADNTTMIGPLEDDLLSAVKDELLDPGELLTVDQARTNSGSRE